MRLSLKKKLLFVHIPRNGGKSIICAVKKAYPDFNHIAWEHARLKDVAKKVKLNKYFKFAVVRNPYERMVSLWSFLGQFKKTYETKKNKIRKASELKDIGFSEWLLKYGKRSHNIVTTEAQQLSWLMVKGEVVVDYIIRFENLAHGFEKATGLSRKCLPLTHVSDHNNYRKYYTDESKAYVDETFKGDIKTWGYEF